MCRRLAMRGRLFDPFVYLGFLAANTNKIALATGSIILPLRHPAHVAKAAATADVLSGGRLILGIASGDRPEEYPALNMSFEDRGQRFRDSFEYIKRMWGKRTCVRKWLRQTLRWHGYVAKTYFR